MVRHRHHHGFETYYVIGEGTLGKSGRGRPTLAAGLGAAVPPFRFSRLGPLGSGQQLGDGNRAKVAAAMTAGVNSVPSTVPAGYTYLGQFVDHDLTFDRTQVMLGTDIPVEQLVQARSPTLDLDALYGAGPQDPVSAKFYSDGVHLKIGAADGGPAFKGFDLPRAGTGANDAAKRAALIPDPRNDENLAVAQTHLAFIRFHNRVVDTLPAAVAPQDRFATARTIVVKHYQWMIRHDFLPRICRAAPLDDVFTHGRKLFEVGAAPTTMPTMPIEFSIGAYRLGHSMVRPAYEWNRNFDTASGTPATLGLLFTFSSTSGDLDGGLVLPSIWIADFRRLYDFAEAGRTDLVVPAAKRNHAMRIDTKLVHPLQTLPQQTIGPPTSPPADVRHNLAFRNLTRAKMVSLATGQQMLAFMTGPPHGLVISGLTQQQIRDGDRSAKLDALSGAERNRLLQHTPLWFYALREAELNGGQMRGVGGRILAETFHRAMEGSNDSIVRDPAFHPTLGPNATTFRMVDLLLFAFEGKKSLLDPLG
jgi:Animal haem peroxidase